MMRISTGCRLLLIMFLSVAMSSLLYAQERTVTGKVTDLETGEDLPGVNILVKGTTQGTVTDVEGNYRLTVPSNATALIFSSIGYAAEEVAIGNQSTIDLSMAADVQALSEIVVTGYSSEERKDVTGAVTTVKSEQLQAVPSGNVEQQLQGRVSGVTVITNGQPGTSSIVRVRGFGSFGGNEPLYIVDGVPVDNTQFLQPDDIESTTVLKDAAAASIYGARAASGVIVYTTKKGKKDGSFRVTYDGVTGVTLPGEGQEKLTPQEEADWTWQAARNTAWQLGEDPTFDHPQYGTGPNPILPDYINVGGTAGYIGSVDLEAERANYNIDPRAGSIYQVVRANKQGTDWWDQITKPALLNRHTLGFSGGTERSAYYVSFGYQDQEGNLLNQRFKRYSFRVNSEHNITDRIRVGENIQTTYYSVLGLTGGAGGRGSAGEENDVNLAYRMPAIIPVYDEFGGYAGTAATGFNNPRNPVANRQRSADNGGYSILGFGNIYAEIDLLDGLMFRSSIGGGYNNFYSNFYGPPQYENSENNSTFNYGENAGAFLNWTFTNTLRYEKTFDRHSVTLLGGVEALNTGLGRTMNGTGQNPSFSDPNYITLTNTTNRIVTSDYVRGVKFFSYFGSAKYIFDDKYIINGVIRRDGSSRFGEENRFGIFPAASVAWRISEEGFMAGVTFVDDLKIRGGWGEMGNSNNVNPNNQFSLYAADLGRSFYDIGGSNGSVTGGFYRSRVGNPNAQWETAVTSNIGLDGSLFGGALDVVVDFWRKDTEGLLYALPLPSVVGPQSAVPSVNIADMRNEGIDLQLITRTNIGTDLNLEVTANAAFLRNEIVDIAPGVPFFEGGNTRFGNVVRNQAGRPMSSFFGYKVVGLYQDQAEVDNSPEQIGKGIGRFRYEDNSGPEGVPDGEITPDDRTYLGDPVPDFTGGLNLKLTYRNWELETFLLIMTGFENFHAAKWFTDFYPSFTGAAKGANVKDSFVPQELGGNGGNTVPIYENISNFSTNTIPNSYYVENGNYARLTNLQIGYNFPLYVLENIGINRLRVYAQATNLFTISNYSGLDPGVGGAADTSFGIDQGNIPVPRGFNLGVNLGF
ncbi:SusC/RagA family TonB-linked outer membrane protein [Catalinimonas niigatensis]|uniref:SusC/RagA family TonB-linked outer membrane protein n=1 Tax=Catalinimonas niigatensis TaxID=1397264 RepID=UPI002AA29F4F|nr:SusC/RagA family TonB-linked outer membrane protein [Catalinimonas niigatensis]WPP53473.1 SusC/RagA family TonB-linked outer membrane protein [Catalinimonas niigatensis]